MPWNKDIPMLVGSHQSPCCHTSLGCQRLAVQPAVEALQTVTCRLGRHSPAVHAELPAEMGRRSTEVECNCRPAMPESIVGTTGPSACTIIHQNHR